MISPDSSRSGALACVAAPVTTTVADQPRPRYVGVQGSGEGVQMAARVARHMSLARASILVFIVVALLTALFMVKMSQGEALPGRPDRQHRSTPLLRTLAQLGPEPAHAARRHRHHHRRRHGRDGDGDGRRQRRRHRHHRHQPRQRLHRPRTVSITGAGTGATATADDHQQRRRHRRHRRRRRQRLQGARRHHLRRRRDHGRHGDRLRRRRRDHAAERRHRLPVPDGRLRHAGRPERHQGRRRTPTIDANGAITGIIIDQPRLGLRHRAERRHP